MPWQRPAHQGQTSPFPSEASSSCPPAGSCVRPPARLTQPQFESCLMFLLLRLAFAGRRKRGNDVRGTKVSQNMTSQMISKQDHKHKNVNSIQYIFIYFLFFYSLDSGLFFSFYFQCLFNLPLLLLNPGVDSFNYRKKGERFCM